MAYTKKADVELLQAALTGYRRQAEILDERIAGIRRQLGDGGDEGSRRGRRRQTDEERSGPEEKLPAKKKHKMSAEGKARIAEATRKRWEAFRAAKVAQAE